MQQQGDPKPEYTLRCFVLVRVAKQFFLHARFEPGQARPDAARCVELAKRVLGRASRSPEPSDDPVVIPGFAGLREFSDANETAMKALSGGAWQSYFQRGNWRMVLPFWRRHQERVAEELMEGISGGLPQALHVFQFPKLGVNHATMAYEYADTGSAVEFLNYDPNSPDEPLKLVFDKERRGFVMPATHYFVGGPVNACSVYRNWLY